MSEETPRQQQTESLPRPTEEEITSRAAAILQQGQEEYFLVVTKASIAASTMTTEQWDQKFDPHYREVREGDFPGWTKEDFEKLEMELGGQEFSIQEMEERFGKKWDAFNEADKEATVEEAISRAHGAIEKVLKTPLIIRFFFETGGEERWGQPAFRKGKN